MTKKITGAVLALLMALLLVPVMAFAEDGHRIDGNLNLVNVSHEDKTLAENGYTWDATGNVLTMQDLTVTGTVILPKMDCTVNVKGTCSVESLSRADSSAAQSVTINGESGATLNAMIDLSGNLLLNNLKMNNGEIRNSNGRNPYVLALNNSNVSLNHLSWMASDGIQLVNSELHVGKTAENQNGQFWTEKITMDEKSVIESQHPLTNYGQKETLEDFINVGREYIAAPAGGDFCLNYDTGTTDKPNTIVVKKTENGVTVVELAKSFTLKAPDAAQPEQPAEDDPVKEPENTHERPVRRFSNAPAAVEEAPKTVEAAKTGDMGVALYAVSAVLSAAGMAWVGKKHGR